MPTNSAKRAKVTVSDLEAALAQDDYFVRYHAFDNYEKQRPSVEAVPALRTLLADEDHALVKTAAYTLRKLGTPATEAMADLLAAAKKLDKFGMPQTYPACVEAMAAIEPAHPELLPLIDHFKALHNWVPISASMRALKVIGTPEALQLLKEMAEFWEPHFNKVEKRVVDKLLSS